MSSSQSSEYPLVSTRMGRAGWILSALIVAWTIGYVTGRYARLPPFLATHYSRIGIPDRWALKTVWRVFAVVWVQLALVGLLGSVAWLLTRRPGARLTDPQSGLAPPQESMAAPSPNAGSGGARDVRHLQSLGEGLGWLTAVMMFCQAVLATRLLRLWAFEAGTFGAVYLLTLLVTVVALLTIALVTSRRMGGRDSSAESWTGTWRHGFYVDPSDPALLVPRRRGRGWTFNFAHLGQVALVAGLLLLAMILPWALIEFVVAP